MIVQKMRVSAPVILMGETGIGKTFLIKYIAKVIFGNKSEFVPFTFHYGIEHDLFVDFMEGVINTAKRNPTMIFCVFFDEFNTSDLQPFVTELMSDRVFSLSENPESTPDRILLTSRPFPRAPERALRGGLQPLPAHVSGRQQHL